MRDYCVDIHSVQFPSGNFQAFSPSTASINGDCDGRSQARAQVGAGRERGLQREDGEGRPPPPPAKVCRRLDYRLATSGLTLLI